MQARYVEGLTIRPLRNGDSGTVAALFDRLGSRSRERRFCGAKPRLSDGELISLARVDGSRHVLIGFVDGDPEPAGIARLVRDGTSAEIAFEVADVHQGRGIGSILARELVADARAAGIRELHATGVRGQPSRRLGPEEDCDVARGELARPSASSSWNSGERHIPSDELSR